MPSTDAFEVDLESGIHATDAPVATSKKVWIGQNAGDVFLVADVIGTPKAIHGP